ncbi:CYTH domain-containing protein [Lactovum odontotermitis]
MPIHLEIEFKSLLSMPEFERLSRLFSHIKPIVQTNFYFDTENLKLRENRLALRIRCFSDAAELTLKVPQKVGNIEHNIDLPLETAKSLVEARSLTDCPVDISEISRIIDSYDIDFAQITCIGWLKTTRREYQMPIGLAALDNNEYLGTSDYELELEVEEAEQGKEDFNNFLEKNGIEYRYARSKVVRFLDTLRYKNRQ